MPSKSERSAVKGVFCKKDIFNYLIISFTTFLLHMIIIIVVIIVVQKLGFGEKSADVEPWVEEQLVGP